MTTDPFQHESDELDDPRGRGPESGGAPIDPIGDAVGKEARIMVKGVRVPDSGPLTDEQRRAIRETANAHIKEYKYNLTYVASQIGCSNSTASEVLRGKYNDRADDSDLLRRFNAWLDADETRRRKGAALGFYPTCVFEAIRGLAKFARSNARLSPNEPRTAITADPPRIVIGWGPAGCGKTLGAEALTAEDPLAIHIRVQQKRGTDSGLARLIVDAVGWRGRPQGSVISFVIDRLTNTGRLLIVDEAHRLSTSGCEFLRDLADVAGIPIMLLCTEEFYTKLTEVRSRTGNLYYDQFSRRVGFVCDLVKGIDGQGGSTRPIYSLDEVRAIFKGDNLRVTSDGLDYLCAAACTIGLGMLGLASAIFELARRSAKRRGGVIDEVLLRSAAKRTLIPAGEMNEDLLQRIDATLANNRGRESGRLVAVG